MIRVLAADDHAIVREGIADLIETQSDMQLIAEASDGREAIEQFRKYQPDITLMDLQMPDMNGIDAINAIHRDFPEARIVVLTTYAGDAHVKCAFLAGAQGYLLKILLRKELLDAIRAVHAGRKRLSPEIAAEIAERAMDAALTAREIDVLKLIAAGNTNKEIAAHLHISEEGVKSSVKSILLKLSANDRAHAAIIGLKRGIIELP